MHKTVHLVIISEPIWPPRKGDFAGKFLNCEPPGLRREANDKFES